jgi:hypothetical protein
MYETILTMYETFYLCMKLPTHVWNFLPMYETFYPCMKLSTHVWNFLPMHETFYPCMKLSTRVWNLPPMHETFYPCMNFSTHVRKFLPMYEKLPTHVRNFLPMYETFYPCIKLHSHVWNFLPMYETVYPCMKLSYLCMKLTTHVWKYFLTWMQNLLWVTDLRPLFKVPTFAQKVLYFFTWVWDPKTWFWRTPSNRKQLLCTCVSRMLSPRSILLHSHLSTGSSLSVRLSVKNFFFFFCHLHFLTLCTYVYTFVCTPSFRYIWAVQK